MRPLAMRRRFGPVGEVREADDADAAHTRGLAQHALGVAQVLHRVELQHDVEAAVLEDREAVLEVELDRVDAAPRAGEHVVVGDLDAVAGALARVAQQREQLAVAAAEVEHTRAGGDEFRDEFHVRALAHDATSSAMRSKRARRGCDSALVEQERIVPVRRLDLGVADAVPCCRAAPDDLARRCRREAPVGAEADQLEMACRVANAAVRSPPCARAGSK
jgi:hypothetical protein